MSTSPSPPEPPSDPPVAADAADESTQAIPAPPRPPAPRRLRRDRRRLLTRREAAVYHLGGLAFELYRRDLLPDGIMRSRAEQVAALDDSVRDIDTRLDEVERARHERRAREVADTSAGCCLVCRTPFEAQARFCWRCGTQIVPTSVGDEQVTAVISSPMTP